MKKTSYIILSLLTALVFTSCRTTKYVPDGQYLLRSVELEGDYDDIFSTDDVRSHIQQLPNSRLLRVWPLSLNIYNLSGEKESRWNNWLRRIGSAPVIYDEKPTKTTAEQLQLYLNSRGYFDAVVTDSMVVSGRKKCRVKYYVEPGQVYNIKTYARNIQDSAIGSLLADSTRSLIRVGDPFDSNVHDEERDRISRVLQERGYYNFNKNNIYFVADSTGGEHLIADSMVMNREYYDALLRIVRPLRPYRIASVDFFIDNQANSSADSAYAFHNFGPFTIYNKGQQTFSDKVIDNNCFVRPGDIYNIADAERTQQRFKSIRMFPSVGISFAEPRDTALLRNDTLDLSCVVRLTQAIPQAYSVDVEGTNSSGNLGGGVGLSYSHNNLFGGAEVLDIKARVSTQKQSADETSDSYFTFETGIEASLTFPNILAPFFTPDFRRKRNPNTVLTAAFDYQRRPDFSRRALATKIAYNIHGSTDALHTITPLELNLVKVPSISDNFRNYIASTYLEYSYRDHLIMSLNYTFLFNQQKRLKSGTAWYLRFSAETAGNILNAIYGKGKDAQIFGIDYSQYVKTDLELRMHRQDWFGNTLALRLFSGIGIPYGNSRALPFEKSYYAGGANSLRAWAVRSLGPGNALPNESLRFHNQTGDMRFEANIEYRYKLVSMLEGALFADAGNIWSLRRTTRDPRATLSSDFHNQIALGAGLGLRLNFSYFIIRLDAATKLHDPSEPAGNRWIISQQPFNWSSINWNFAIGYPF